MIPNLYCLEPPKEIPGLLLDEFTYQGRVKIAKKYFDSTKKQEEDPKYCRFQVFLFKNCMHVKIVEVGWFAIKTIISIHVLKKFWKNVKIYRKFPWFYLLKVSFSGHFLTCTHYAPRCKISGFCLLSFPQNKRT